MSQERRSRLSSWWRSNDRETRGEIEVEHVWWRGSHLYWWSGNDWTTMCRRLWWRVDDWTSFMLTYILSWPTNVDYDLASLLTWMIMRLFDMTAECQKDVVLVIFYFHNLKNCVLLAADFNIAWGCVDRFLGMRFHPLWTSGREEQFDINQIALRRIENPGN